MVSERTRQAIISFMVGLGIVEIPVLIDYLTAVPQPDAKILLAGILGGLLATLKRYVETAPSSVAALHQETYEREPPPRALLDDPRRGGGTVDG
jgi:hypothetical protein